MDMTVDTPAVTALHVIRFTTVPRRPGRVGDRSSRAGVSQPGFTTQVDVVHDMMSVLEQWTSTQDLAPQAAVAWCREQLDALPSGPGNVLGRTVVVFARVPEADRDATAHELLA